MRKRRSALDRWSWRPARWCRGSSAGRTPGPGAGPRAPRRGWPWPREFEQLGVRQRCSHLDHPTGARGRPDRPLAAEGDYDFVGRLGSRGVGNTADLVGDRGRHVLGSSEARHRGDHRVPRCGVWRRPSRSYLAPPSFSGRDRAGRAADGRRQPQILDPSSLTWERVIDPCAHSRGRYQLGLEYPPACGSEAVSACSHGSSVSGAGHLVAQGGASRRLVESALVRNATSAGIGPDRDS
jgi:hypothetical protein